MPAQECLQLSPSGICAAAQNIAHSLEKEPLGPPCCLLLPGTRLSMIGGVVRTNPQQQRSSETKKEQAMNQRHDCDPKSPNHLQRQARSSALLNLRGPSPLAVRPPILSYCSNAPGAS